VSALFPCGPHDSSVAAINFNSLKRQRCEGPPTDKELVGVYLTAGESSRHLGTSDDALYALCWEAARRLCPSLGAEPEPLALHRWAEAIPIHAVGSYRAAANALASQCGPMAFAGDYLATATVDGALASGVRAARVLCRSGAAPESATGGRSGSFR
jgi:predicted NAD/FAD-dependent oxidoreductase